MTVTRQDLTDAILAVRDGLVSSGRYASFREINSGYCQCFCGDVTEMLGVPADAEEPFELGIDNLMLCEDDEPTVMDRDLISRGWPMVRPPLDMDWDDVDRMAANSSFSSGTHVWLCHEGRHYDAEAPDGVDNLFELPFFQRIAATYLEKRDLPAP